jgi:4'-phosphopantetheinyl transferase
MVGIDAERIDPAKADFAVAETYFAPAEIRLLHKVPVDDRIRFFFCLWTLKEAYIKAIGTGLGTPLDSFAFGFEPLRIEFAPGVSSRAADWRFAVLPTTEQHVLSVAVRRSAGEIVRIAAHPVAPRNISTHPDPGS